MRIVLLPEAERDIEEARAWYGAESPELEVRFTTALYAVFTLLLAYPLAFQESSPGVRHVSLPRFPYLIYYLVEDGSITVLGVLHMKRHPDTLAEKGL